MSFQFNLEDEVKISVSGETGIIVGRSEYPNSCDSYLIRYAAGDGRAVESWWSEDALENK